MPSHALISNRIYSVQTQPFPISLTKLPFPARPRCHFILYSRDNSSFSDASRQTVLVRRISTLIIPCTANLIPFSTSTVLTQLASLKYSTFRFHPQADFRRETDIYPNRLRITASDNDQRYIITIITIEAIQ